VDQRQDLWKSLVKETDRFSKMFGEFKWEEAAEVEMAHWVKNRCYPEPEHSKLVHYNPKRAVHTTKLAMISSASRGDGMIITLKDLERARNWLLHTESLMPNIFRDMKGRSDHQILQEVYMFMWQQWVKDKKPLHENLILHFLSERTTTANISKMLELIERTGMAVRDAGTKLYTPRPKHLHGME
jgi:hypothetical protein